MKKILPRKSYEFKIDKEHTIALKDLINKTEITTSLGSVITKKTFIGQVDDTKFKLITSIIGKGAFCVFNGEIKGNTGVVDVQVHKVFKILISIWLILPIIAASLSILEFGFLKSIGVITIIVIALLVLRFLVIELLFNSVSENGLEKLSNTIGITEIIEK